MGIEMRKELQEKIQEDYPFMKQTNVESELNTYRCYGFECADGWYDLIDNCLKEIVARYVEDGIGLEDIDFVPEQVKEKFGTLSFFYTYQALEECEDIEWNKREEAYHKTYKRLLEDPKVKKRHEDIREIVSRVESLSSGICEFCGAEGEVRNHRKYGLDWLSAQCDRCNDETIARLKAKMSEREAKSKEERGESMRP